LLFALFVHPNITETVSLFLKCKQIGKSPTDLYLVADISQRCWSPTHKKWFGSLAVLMLIFYVIGIPAIISWLLKRNREKLLSDPRVRMKYSFLYKGFKPQYYYWEMVVLLRKSIIVFIGVFSSNVQVQAALVLATVAVAYSVHQVFKPFTSDKINDLESLSLIVTFFTFLLGTLFGWVNNSVGQFLSFLIVLLNIGFWIMALRTGYSSAIITVRKKKYQVCLRLFNEKQPKGNPWMRIAWKCLLFLLLLMMCKRSTLIVKTL